MSKYTTQVRWIIDELVNRYYPGQDLTTKEKIIHASPKIFEQYPIWNPDYYTELNYKILSYYYTREIAWETSALWKLKINQKLEHIMPYYIELWKTTQNDIDYLNDTYYTESSQETEDYGSNRDITNHQDNTSKIITDLNNSANRNSIFSDFPQTPISTYDYATNQTKDEESNIQHDEQNSQGSLNSGGVDRLNSNRNKNYNKSVRGNIGSKTQSQLIREYREILLNLDMQIIKELEPQFMALW